MTLDPTIFPLREGGSVPRDMVAVHEARLTLCHGVPLTTLAARGGISVFELLLLQPAPAGIDRDTYTHGVCDLTVTGAMSSLSRLLTAWHKQREADAEAAMLAMMEAEDAEPVA